MHLLTAHFFCARNVVFQQTQIYGTSFCFGECQCFDLHTTSHRSVHRKYVTKEDALKVFETISGDNYGSDIETDEEFHIETVSSLSDEDWIFPSATSEFDSSDGESSQNTK